LTDLVTGIIEFENGSLSEKDTLKLFSKLIKSGQAWQLQGSYGRLAKNLIDNKLINEKGKINWNRLDELKEEQF